VVAAGDVAHDAVDSGNPIKIGAEANEYQASGGLMGPSEVADGDRANLVTNRQGELVTAVKPQYTLLTGIDDTYDGTPSTNTSATVEIWPYRYCIFGTNLTETGTATDIEIDIMVSVDDTNYMKLMNGGLSRWIYDDTTVSGGLERAYGFPVSAVYLQVVITVTGGSGGNSFTVDDSFIHCRT
jgi:hypothetical protein